MINRKIQEIKIKFEKFKKIFGLENEKILLLLRNNGASAISKDNNTWEIEFNFNHPLYELIHELGHIFLYKKTNYIYFAIPPDNIKKSIFNKPQ